MLTLVEAMNTGKKFKRRDAADWYDVKDTGNNFSAADIKAKDWVTESCVIVTNDLTLQKLEVMYTQINVDAPGISRGAFRELVKLLSGITIK